MQNFDLQLEGISEADLEKVLKDARLSPDAYKVNTPSRSTGNTIVDIMLELSKIDLNALSVVIGYLMGTGVALFYMEGVRKKIGSVSDAHKLLKKLEKLNQADEDE
ncbi:hypothetical protein EDE15_4022 [Edaphobacter aggregans]|uniref:Uncharacterized protein n=1 Tax=Edaphobacter aggregans TaxID=570835 RepID=A0A428MNH6_9BACT|nr:hypothetical protein [Edaphobacter aggregans]RSL18449.1 hypothetical protein EDE15_4022 [Edaphobacter aggregans]